MTAKNLDYMDEPANTIVIKRLLNNILNSKKNIFNNHRFNII